MDEEKNRFFGENEFTDLVKRYEDNVSGRAGYYFDVDEFEVIIDHYLATGKSNRAYNAVQRALKLHPSSTSIQLKKAVIFNEKSQPNESLRILRTIERIEINNPEVHYIKGIALNLLGDFNSSVNQFERAIELSEEGKPEMLLNIAMAFDQTNNLKASLIYLLKAHELEPDNLPYLYDIAYCYERMDQPEKAIEFYNKYLDINSFCENVWYNIGVVYNRIEVLDKAVEAYDFAIALDEEFASAYFNKANTLANRGDYLDAIPVYKELLYLEEDNEQVACYIGECYEKLEKWNPALEYYRKVLDINPDYADAWLGLGMVMSAKGSYNEGLYYVEKAIRYFPENPEYWYSAGNIYLKLNRRQDAIDSYNKAVRFDPEDNESWIRLAEVYIDMKDTSNAIKTLEQANEKNPGLAVINYRLAAYYLMDKNKKKADVFLRTALSLDFDMHKDFFAYYPKATGLSNIRKIINAYQRA